MSRDEVGALDHLMDAAYPESGYSPTNANDNPDIDDESDDDDSNPLEDLEALGDIEEQENQIREDEEGLRNARELARQGWEGSNGKDLGLSNGVAEHTNSSHPPDSVIATHPDAAMTVLPDAEMAGDRPGTGKIEEDVKSYATVPSHDMEKEHSGESFEAVPPEEDDAKPAFHAGFQAVNGTMPHQPSTSE